LSGIAPWHELTPQARAAVKTEIYELLREVPNRDAGLVIFDQMPDVALPKALETLRELKEKHER
jgi:hypothetical protein